jgi:integrase
MKKTRNLAFDGNRWSYDFTHRGRRIRHGGFMNKVQAETAMLREKTRLIDEDLGLVKPKAEAVSFDAFADDFMRLYSKPGKRSWRRDETALAHAREFFNGKMLPDITTRDVEAYKAERAVRVEPGTVNRELMALKTLFTKAIEWGKLEASPAAKVKRFKEPPPRDRILTTDEAQRLLEAADAELRPILEVALGTGMRRGEILALRWADVDLVRGIISVRMSKSGKPRLVPVSGQLAGVLGALKPRGDRVFGQSAQAVRWAFKAACAKAKIAGFRFHDCRHTFASRALERGADLVSVSRILGHASVVMTARYLHGTTESQRLAVEKVAEFLAPTRQKVDTQAVSCL